MNRDDKDRLGMEISTWLSHFASVLGKIPSDDKTTTNKTSEPGAQGPCSKRVKVIKLEDVDGTLGIALRHDGWSP